MSILNNDSIFAFVEESTEGTVAVPSSATDGYVACKVGATSLEPGRDLKERTIFDGTLAMMDPRLGMKSVSGKAGVEMKASGTEGSEPDYGILLESLLPDVNAISARNTTKASGNTGSLLQIEDADIADYTVGDFIVVLQSGAYHPCWITAKATGAGVATITVSPAKASGSFSNSVEISKSVTYRPADTGHLSFSSNFYWGSGGDGVKQTGLGCRTSGVEMNGFTTGELPGLDFSFEGMTYTHAASSNAPHTPTFDTSLPSVVLNSKIYKDGTSVNVNEVKLKIEQPIKFLTATGDANGKIAGRAAGKRKVTGSINPYTDGASVANFTAWDAGTTFALTGYTANPDSSTGLALGSIVGFYLPRCVITKINYADAEGVIIENIEFMASSGAAGGSMECAIGFC